MNADPLSQNPVFDRAVRVTFLLEGNGALSLDPEDGGNWTGGAPGHGVLRGTRWGFSAAAFPMLDIENLDLALATGKAFAEFWLPAKCAAMPGALALLVFDAAFQHGVPRAVAMLQRALGISDDGVIGAVTQGAVREAAGRGLQAIETLCVDFQTQRAIHMAQQPSWLRDEDGLARRLFTTMQASTELLCETQGGVG